MSQWIPTNKCEKWLRLPLPLLIPGGCPNRLLFSALPSLQTTSQGEAKGLSEVVAGWNDCSSVTCQGQSRRPDYVEINYGWRDSLHSGHSTSAPFSGKMTVYLFSVQCPDKGNDVVLDDQTDPVAAGPYAVVGAFRFQLFQIVDG